MPISSADVPTPKVAVSLAQTDILRTVLEPIWRAAQEDQNAYIVLRAGFEEGLIDALYLHSDLAYHIRALQPVGMQAPSVFAYPSTAMLVSCVTFICIAISAVLAFLGAAFSRPPSTDVYRRLSRVADAVHIAFLQHFKPMDPYTLEIVGELWRIACSHPSTLDDHVPGNLAISDRVSYTHPHDAHHRDLAWSIYKLRRNAQSRVPRLRTSPVEKIPFELLSYILALLPRAYPRFELSDGHDFWNKSSHLRPRLVCKTWRDVIDQTTALWTQMVLGFGSTMTARALFLSKLDLLDVDIAFETPWTLSHSLVLKDLWRIRRLAFQTEFSDTPEQLVLALRASTARELTSIHVWPFREFEGHRRVVLPDDIFKATPPMSLQTVDILDCTIVFPSPLFTPSLVTLKLVRCDVWEDLDRLIDTFSSLPRLEIFEWKMGLTTLSRTDSPVRLHKARFLTSTRQAINLPRMRVFDVECPMACAAALMHHLVIPPSCEVILGDDYTLTGVLAQDLGAREEVMTSLTASLGDHLTRVFPAHLSTGYDSVSVSEYPGADAGKGALLVECRRDDRMYPPCSISLFVANGINNRLDDDTVVFLLRGILQWPSMSVVATRFETNHEVFSNPALWTAVLGSLPRTRHLYLHNGAQSDASDSIFGLGQALNWTLDIIPALAHIQLQCLSFPTLCQQRLAEAAGHRQTAGNAAIIVYVEGCTNLGPDGALEWILRVHSNGALYPDVSTSARLGPRVLR